MAIFDPPTAGKPEDRVLTPFEEAAQDVKEVQITLLHQVEELAIRMRPALRVSYESLAKENSVGRDDMPGPDKSPHVRRLNELAADGRRVSDVLSHLLKNLEI